MVVTVELSMYPFATNFHELIQAFIGELQTLEGIRITPGPTSSVLVGDYRVVMECVTEMMHRSYQEHGRSVFVAKILPGYDPDNLSDGQD